MSAYSILQKKLLLRELSFFQLFFADRLQIANYIIPVVSDSTEIVAMFVFFPHQLIPQAFVSVSLDNFGDKIDREVRIQGVQFPRIFSEHAWHS